MKKVKMARSDSYQNYLVESLKDNEEAAAYIEAILEVENPEPQLLSSALNDVIDARLSMNNLSEAAKINWERLQQMLVLSSGAEIYQLVALLNTLGFSLVVNLQEEENS